MPTSYKAVALARELADKYRKRLTLTVTEGVDSSNNPTILVGAASAGATGAFILIKPVDQSATVLNAIGQAAAVYTPHFIQVCFEANPAGGAGADVNSLATIANILGEIFADNCRVEVYQSANGTVPSASQLTAANLQTTYDDLYWPLQRTS